MKTTKLIMLDHPSVRTEFENRSRLFDGFELIWDKDPLKTAASQADPAIGAVILSPDMVKAYGDRIQEERSEAVAKLAQGIGHEFGNILLRMVGKTDLAMMETDIQKIHAHLSVLMSATERATLIVRNLQAFSRSEVTLQPGSLGQVLDQAIETMGADIARYKVKVEKVWGKPPIVQLDPSALTQAFCNVILNGLQSMHQGPGTLTIKTESLDDGARVSIKDTGVGIEESALPHIFEFGFTTRGARGGGIGLSIAKRILVAHGATIEVKSKVGQGTEVLISFRSGIVGKKS